MLEKRIFFASEKKLVNRFYKSTRPDDSLRLVNIIGRASSASWNRPLGQKNVISVNDRDRSAVIVSPKRSERHG